MFRRKDEFDMDGNENSAQGSLLAGANVAETNDTVSILSPQQAAQYQASNQSNAPATSNSFSSASSFGTVRPAAEPARPISSTNAASNAFRPANSPSPAQAAPAARTAAESRPISSSFSSSSTSAISSLTTQAKESRRVLTVGTEILLKGEITTCDRLVIEGKVDATVTEVQTMELAEAGSFKGYAEVEYAEISGVFEGELIVKSTLVIFSSGKVRGKITYGEIEIERGGELTGEVKTIGMVNAAGGASRKTKEDKVAA